MHPDRTTVCKEIRPYSLFVIPDNPKTLTLQPAIVRMTPPGTPFLDPLYGILPGHGPDLRFVYVCVYRTVTTADVMIAVSTLPLRQ